MRTTPLENRIAEVAAPIAKDLGLEIVLVKIVGEGGSRNVQIMAENPQTKRLGIDDCTNLSKALSAVFDVEDPIDGAYRLEISSPGIDRPLVKEQDFETYVGQEARLETATPAENGQKKFRGFIKGIEGEMITLETDTGDVRIDFSTLTKAKLVLTDKLIKDTAHS